MFCLVLWATGCGSKEQAKRAEWAGSNQKAVEVQRSGGGEKGVGVIFEDVTRGAGVQFVHQLADGVLSNIMESDGAGGAVLDADGDGWLDVYLVNSGPALGISDSPPGTKRLPNGLFRNRGDGTFEDITVKAGVAGHGFGITAAAADYDNDGDSDLLVVNLGSTILYRNEGNATFEEVTEAAGICNEQAGISATWLDADLDGYLDLFLANYLVYDPAVRLPAGSPSVYPGPLAYGPELNLLFRNRGDGTFEDVSERAGVRVAGHRAMSVAPLDFDLDGDTDLYVSNDGTPNLLLVNDGKGQFKDEGLLRGAAVNPFGAAEGSMGAAVGDCDSDGLPDLLVTRFGTISLYLNSKGGLFEDRISASGILEFTRNLTGWGGNFLDFDNDTDLDLFIVNGDSQYLKGMRPLLLENMGAGKFKDASLRAGPFFREQPNGRGSGAFDMDNDGRLDLVLTTLGGGAVLLRNIGGRTNHWLTLKLEGTQSNREGLGARVVVRLGGKQQQAQARCPTSYVFQQDPRLHFGLGNNAHVDRVEIRWPSGQMQALTNVAADRILVVREPGESRWEGKNGQ